MNKEQIAGEGALLALWLLVVAGVWLIGWVFTMSPKYYGLATLVTIATGYVAVWWYAGT